MALGSVLTDCSLSIPSSFENESLDLSVLSHHWLYRFFWGVFLIDSQYESVAVGICEDVRRGIHHHANLKDRAEAMVRSPATTY
ncbi:hypothetical protein EBZ35_02940 [bacterium]|nr:hypothetical protein [bacterium]